MGKQCRKCSVDLVVDNNWAISQHKCGNYICKTCKASTFKKALLNPEFKKKQYEMNHKYNLKKGYQNRVDDRYAYPAGIYGVYNNNELIYIGESGTPKNRQNLHFSEAGKINGDVMKHKNFLSPISIALGLGELQRVNLTFKMLELIDDTKVRQAQEKRLIQRYKPVYNDLYV